MIFPIGYIEPIKPARITVEDTWKIGQQWRPIETAPKDGTKLLLFDGEDIDVGFYYNGFANLDEFCWVRPHDTSCIFSVTHWMPLPEPPK